MKTTPGKFIAFKHTLLAAGLALVAQFPAHAQSMPEGPAGFPGHGGPGMEGHGFMHPGMPGFEAPFGHMTGPDFLRELKLSEEQQDKIFAIEHAQQPQLREQMKALHKAQEALHAMRFSAQYDDSKAKALTDISARAMADSALLRLRGEQQIYALLTTEQRKQLEEMRNRFKAHAGHGPEQYSQPSQPK
ncbi:Spy/CpxP family protein refolding chaperone [Undibacterium sp.]|uniref:Spy/CpxP family protein refolding chaperone n=1 Tax=Undibacterium sp. TaxID=1914977 RepID=UPI00374C94F3